MSQEKEKGKKRLISQVENVEENSSKNKEKKRPKKRQKKNEDIYCSQTHKIMYEPVAFGSGTYEREWAKNNMDKLENIEGATSSQSSQIVSQSSQGGMNFSIHKFTQKMIRKSIKENPDLIAELYYPEYIREEVINLIETHDSKKLLKLIDQHSLLLKDSMANKKEIFFNVCEKGDFETLKPILEGIDFTLLDEKEIKTAILVCGANKNIGINGIWEIITSKNISLQTLLNISKDIKNQGKNSVLFALIKKLVASGKEDWVISFLEKKILTVEDILDDEGNRLLHVAVFYEQKELVEKLIVDFNAQHKSKNSSGLTASDVAMKQNNLRLAEKIQQCGSERKYSGFIKKTEIELYRKMDEGFSLFKLNWRPYVNDPEKMALKITDAPINGLFLESLNCMVIALKGGTIVIYDCEKNEIKRFFQSIHIGEARGLKLYKEKYLILCVDKGIFIYDLESFSEQGRYEFSPNTKGFSDCETLPNERMAVSFVGDKCLTLLDISDIKNPRFIQKINLESQPVSGTVTKLKYIKGAMLAFGCSDGAIGVLDLDVGYKIIKTNKHAQKQISCLEVSKDGCLISNASANRLLVWNIDKNTVKTLTDKQNIIYLSKLPNDQVISVGAEGIISIWDISTDKCLQRLELKDNLSRVSACVVMDKGKIGVLYENKNFVLWEASHSHSKQKMKKKIIYLQETVHELEKKNAMLEEKIESIGSALEFLQAKEPENQDADMGQGSSSSRGVHNLSYPSYFFKRPIDMKKLQDEFVKEILKGNVKAVKGLYAQGANIAEKDSKGMYPLVAAAYSGNFEVLEYIKMNVDYRDLKRFWNLVDKEEAEKYINLKMPEKRPDKADFKWLADWYTIHAAKGSSWCELYDDLLYSKCSTRENLNRENYIGIDWSGRANTLQTYKAQWEKSEQCWHPDGYFFHPSPQIHDEIVVEVTERLNKFKKYVEREIDNYGNEKAAINYPASMRKG